MEFQGSWPAPGARLFLAHVEQKHRDGTHAPSSVGRGRPRPPPSNRTSPQVFVCYGY